MNPAVGRGHLRRSTKAGSDQDLQAHCERPVEPDGANRALTSSQVVQKLGEELVECLTEAMAGNRDGLVAESADVLYHLLITWVYAGIQPEEVWAELTERERASHLTEGAEVPAKRLLSHMRVGTTKIP